MDDQLKKHREQASAQSQGSSSDKIYSKALELVSQYTSPGYHMDFGAGNGTFLEVLQRNFSEMSLVGIDLMKKPAQLDESVEWVVEDLNHKLPFADHSFDSISALEIIEHLENPRHVFRELYRTLKPDGYLVLSTPNNESWRAMTSYILRGHFVSFTDSSYPAHITPLNRKDLARAAMEAGFQVEQWSDSGEGAVPGITKLTWQNLTFGILSGLRYSDNIFLVLVKKS